MKITDAKLLNELYNVEADWKLLIGHRFKSFPSATRPVNGHHSVPKRSALATGKARKRVKSKTS